MDVGGLTRSNLTPSKSEKNGEGRGGDVGEWAGKGVHIRGFKGGMLGRCQ